MNQRFVLCVCCLRFAENGNPLLSRTMLSTNRDIRHILYVMEIETYNTVTNYLREMGILVVSSIDRYLFNTAITERKDLPAA